MSLFGKILIANRGEIACRIIKTAQKLGIKTVAIFSEVDASALHVTQADEAYLLGPAPSKESYLNIEKIIAIAKRSYSDAIHPGYGFLSENADFARACEQNNIVFIGPSAATIALMGDKNAAKEKMQQHDIPILPGYYDVNQNLDTLLLQAKKIGFPIVLKAVAGGGGKGLRLVHQESEFESAYHAVRREAKAFFNDEKVLIEKYLTNARHVEVQVLADHFGAAHHLYTRDCSIQRRHQKIIEEAPAPNIPVALHEQITATAVTVAKAIQYSNAGTIEFLVEQNAFYFMEMNTRLQVEHPVTEMITGIDIVEWQLRIASGEKLFSKSPRSSGHAIEVRLNAEDPDNDFMPSMGKLEYFHLPQTSARFRIDSGYQEGDEINIYYDSLLAKMILLADNRQNAIQALLSHLNQVEVFGIKTNLPLLKAILKNQHFITSCLSTRFLQQEELILQEIVTPEVYCIASIALSLIRNVSPGKTQDSFSPWCERDDWQLFFPSQFYVHFQGEISVGIERRESGYRASVSEQLIDITLLKHEFLKPTIVQLTLLINGQYFEANVGLVNNQLEIITKQNAYLLELKVDEAQQVSHQEENQLIAPMPGTLVALMVNPGQKVAKGEKLLVIEAMKMEHTILAPRDGTVKQCLFKIGDIVKEGSELLELE